VGVALAFVRVKPRLVKDVIQSSRSVLDTAIKDATIYYLKGRDHQSSPSVSGSQSALCGWFQRKEVHGDLDGLISAP
jgi:hypothetical protein